MPGAVRGRSLRATHLFEHSIAYVLNSYICIMVEHMALHVRPLWIPADRDPRITTMLVDRDGV